MNFYKFLALPKKVPDAVGVVPYGCNKKQGGHDHRYNQGDDRTPAQKEGDIKRRKV